MWDVWVLNVPMEVKTEMIVNMYRAKKTNFVRLTQELLNSFLGIGIYVLYIYIYIYIYMFLAM